MVLSLRKKLKYFFLLLAILCLFFSILYFKDPHSFKRANQEGNSFENHLHPQQRLDVVSTDSPPIQSQCTEWQKKYESLSQLKKGDSPLFRFANIHKRIETTVYRLRHFFKEGPEGEIETFLVYQEDSNETARIVEKGPYKKGKLYHKIEASSGEILYQEEGYNLEEDLFLHYINGKLKTIQNKLGECQY